MLKTFQNIERNYQQMKRFFLICLGLMTLMSLSALFFSYHIYSQSREKIYVLVDGHALQVALSTDKQQNRPAQARKHIQDFHEYFYSLEPDARQIEENIQKALYMGDSSVVTHHLNYKEKGYYNSLIAGSISQEIEIDSIQVDFKAHTIEVRCYARQKLIRATSITSRELVSECELREVTITDRNPMGFLIENYRIVSNQTLKTEQR